MDHVFQSKLITKLRSCRFGTNASVHSYLYKDQILIIFLGCVFFR